MQCPLDGTTLAIANRESIEIDYCPQCRGVWLDRGELDKLIERSASEYGAYGRNPAAAPPRQDARYERPPHYQPRYDDDDYRRGGHKKRRRGFLDEMFDFG